MEPYAYKIEMTVRDYECDIQGIVNNSVYQNYLEHARHEYIKSLGIDFKEYAKQGINFVVVRVELDYKLPLASGDKFWIGVSMIRESKVKIVFLQDIFHANTNKPVLKGKIITTALNQRGRPEIPEAVEIILAKQNNG